MPKPTGGEERSDFIARCNRELSDELEDADQRNAVCARQWREAKPSSSTSARHVFGEFRTSQDGAEVRRETIGDVEHIVVPAVLIREGVFQCANCPAPELYPASEFARVPTAWNGRPVTVGHPQRDGMFVSASQDPDGWNTWRVGTVFGTHLDGDKLKAELWIDPSKLEEASVAALEDGAEFDVSIAAWYDVIPQVGERGGRRYEAVQRAYMPDHVALLPEGVRGACSWDDGCGAPRVNVGHLRVAEASCCDGCAAGQPCEGARPDLGAMLMAAATGMSDDERRDLLERALRETLGRDSAYIVAVFEDAVVYATWSEDRQALLERGYSISGDGVEFADEVVEVRPVVQYRAVEGGEQEEVMTAEINPKTAGDRPQDGKTQGTTQQPPDTITSAAPSAPTLKELFASASPEERREAIRSAMSPEEIEVQEQGRRLYLAERGKKVARIKAHARNPYSDDELNAMAMADLDKIAAFLPEPDQPQGPTDYGFTAPRGSGVAAEPEWFTPAPPSVFGPKAAPANGAGS